MNWWTTKGRLIIAMAIGVLISSIFLAVPSLRDGTGEWAGLQLPGMAAAVLFWGAVGGSVFSGLVISSIVNAVVYGLGAFAILSFIAMAN